MLSYIIFILMIFSLCFLIYAKYNALLTPSIILKFITSLLFIIICISSYLTHRGSILYFICIFTALFFSLIGDIFLAFPINISRGTNINFKRGLISFSFAHVFFAIGFITLISPSSKTILMFLIFLSAQLIILKSIKGFNFNGMLVFVIIYLSIISFMLSTSLFTLNLITKNYGSIFVASGTILFFISDIILSFIYFYKKSPKQLIPLNLITYYIGQGLIALSLLYF